MKILLTGGHLTPALSFIDYVSKHHSQEKLVFVGREFSQDELRQESVERYEVEKRNLPFITFQAVRLGGSFYRRPIQNLRKFFDSVKQAKKILRQQKPAVMLSFGGYLAVPLALAAKSLRIPIVTHEQTASSGLANRLIGRLADKVAVSFTETLSEFPSNKAVLTGNPLRAGVFSSRHPKPDWLPSKLNQPLILVMGGNQGSQAINQAVADSLPELTKDWIVIHQCGKPTADQPYQAILNREKQRLPKKLQSNYFIKEWIDDQDLFWLYRHAFCAISRSGANATQELAAAGVPSILVPLPNSRGNEQAKNAQWLVRAGGAVLLDQAELRASTLLKSLATMKTLEPTIRKNLNQISMPENAAEQLYEVVAGVVKK